MTRGVVPPRDCLVSIRTHRRSPRRRPVRRLLDDSSWSHGRYDRAGVADRSLGHRDGGRDDRAGHDRRQRLTWQLLPFECGTDCPQCGIVGDDPGVSVQRARDHSARSGSASRRISGGRNHVLPGADRREIDDRWQVPGLTALERRPLVELRDRYPVRVRRSHVVRQVQHEPPGSRTSDVGFRGRARRTAERRSQRDRRFPTADTTDHPGGTGGAGTRS